MRIRQLVMHPSVNAVSIIYFNPPRFMVHKRTMYRQLTLLQCGRLTTQDYLTKLKLKQELPHLSTWELYQYWEILLCKPNLKQKLLHPLVFVLHVLILESFRYSTLVNRFATRVHAEYIVHTFQLLQNAVSLIQRLILGPISVCL